MEYTLVLGDTNELRCIIAFMELGYECSVPYGNGAKYDFIADINGNLLRIQCKNSHYVIRNGETDTDAFQFSTTSQTTNTKKCTIHKYTSEQIDYFATSFEGKVYIVSVSECSTSKTLRFSPPKNNNIYNRAEDYEINTIFNPDKNYQESKNKFLDKDYIIKEFHCPECGKVVSKEGNLCVECANKKQEICTHPNRDTLKQLIRNASFTQIGEQFNVTDNTIRKWCKKYKLPYTKKEINSINNNDWELI